MKRTGLLASATLALIVATQIGGASLAHARQEVNPADFSSTITNPLFPLSLVGPKIFEGEETDEDTGEVVETRLESRVLPQTIVVEGVTVTVLEEKAYADGELIELALDYFAQHKDGSVYYFGEAVDNYEDGVLKDHNGQWRADEGQNRPGVIMPATPVVGATYEQEFAPGIAEDMGTVMAINEAVNVPSGSYTGCLKTKDFTPLEPGIEEFKWYCPGIGMAKEEGDGSLLELISIGPAPAAPAATPTTPAAAAPAAAAPVSAPNTGSGPTGAATNWPIAAASAVLLAIGGAGLLAAGRIRG